MDEYLCLTVRSRPGEAEGEFKARLSAFWTHMHRDLPDDFERVYAETTAFTTEGDRLVRQYLFESAIADVLARELSAAGIDFDPIDPDDLYSKYEATPPEWMWIEH
ncbi:MAG TPA: hypothetical protein VIL46_06070 [Gemmataceae bacterium]